jgi:hypothetical protein
METAIGSQRRPPTEPRYPPGIYGIYDRDIKRLSP